MEAKLPLNTLFPVIPRETSPRLVPSQHAAEPKTQPRTIVTRGFSPSQIPVSCITSLAAKDLCATSESTDAPAPKAIFPKKQQAQFALGGSSSYEEESVKNPSLKARRSRRFQIGGSSREAAVQGKQRLQRPVPTGRGQKKTASLNGQVVAQTYTSSAISDTEEGYDEDWEDETAEESGSFVANHSVDFRRVGSRADLPSRRSLITLMLSASNTRDQGALQPTSALSYTVATPDDTIASPNNDSNGALLMKGGTACTPLSRPINEVPPSAAQPINIVTASMHHQAVLSPRSTRRNMLATELTESLRRNLVRERSQTTQTANAVLKRRHTSHDVRNLEQFPDKAFTKEENKEDVDTTSSSWDRYFETPFTAHQAQAW